MARRANATPALALLSFRQIHRLKEPTEPEGRYHYGVNRTRSHPPTHRRISLNRNRRLAKDFEATIASAETWLMIASVKLLSRRLARA